MASNTGRTVVVHYTGTLEDGSVFDSSKEREPFEFVAGSGQVIPGFDAAVADLAVGDTVTVVIAPEQAYGERFDEEVQTVPVEIFNGQIPPAGQIVMLETPEGQQIAATSVGASMKGVELDFNHPLAGKTLTFEIEMLDVRDAPAQEEEEETTD